MVCIFQKWNRGYNRESNEKLRLLVYLYQENYLGRNINLKYLCQLMVFSVCKLK